MAGYECSLCDGAEQATLLITPLTGGDTMAVGQSCMPIALAGMLAGDLGIDPEQLYEAARAIAEAPPPAEAPTPGPNGDSPPAARPRPRRPRQAKAATTKDAPQ